jgi:dihydroorotase
MGCLDKLHNFACVYGAKFYDLPVNTEKIKLQRKPTTIPEKIESGSTVIVPFKAGETLNWSIAQ